MCIRQKLATRHCEPLRSNPGPQPRHIAYDPGLLRGRSITVTRFCARWGPAFLAFACTTSAFADDTGRDFPKTLIFDEPGIDDEISLPTLIFVPGGESDVDFELDKRLTTRLSVQVNIGYAILPRFEKSATSGWQNSDVTLKYVVLADRPAEQLVSLSLVRELGGSGARRIGAEAFGATDLAVNFGQGFAAVARSPWLKPFAITGSGGFLVPDEGAVQQALLSASLQYSFNVLGEEPAGAGMPAFLRPFIPIVEYTSSLPTRGAGARGLLAPGLIYAGEGFQLAAEALVPLTRAAGLHVGAIAQLNISLEMLGLPALARPLF